MGCQSEVNIGDNLTFSITTHDPDTGELTDADALPIYRIYEDETAVPILAGTMALLDAVNTTGFYTELIACTVANGFEDRRTYTIYIEATVDADTGGICYAFRATTLLSCAGCINYTYTLTEPGPGPPIADVTVNISTDIAGLYIVWCGITDAFGVARDMNGQLPCLDPGTYYFWRSRANYEFINPDTEIVS